MTARAADQWSSVAAGTRSAVRSPSRASGRTNRRGKGAPRRTVRSAQRSRGVDRSARRRPRPRDERRGSARRGSCPNGASRLRRLEWVRRWRRRSGGGAGRRGEGRQPPGVERPVRRTRGAIGWLPGTARTLPQRCRVCPARVPRRSAGALRHHALEPRDHALEVSRVSEGPFPSESVVRRRQLRRDLDDAGEELDAGVCASTQVSHGGEGLES